MVHPVDRKIRRLRLVGGGVPHHVAADGDIKLPAREGFGKPLEVGGIGEVHRDIVREEVDMELVGHRHADNLPPDQMGLGFFRPGELIDREVNLEAQIPDCPHNPLMGEGEGVEGPGEEGDLIPVLKAERAVIDPLQRDEPVDMRESRRPVEEGELPAAVLFREKEELFAAQGENTGFLLVGKPFRAEDHFADDRKRLLPDLRAVIGQPVEQHSEQPAAAAFKGAVRLEKPPRIDRAAFEQDPDGMQRNRHDPVVGAAQQAPKSVDQLVKLLRMEQESKLAEIFRDIL